MSDLEMVRRLDKRRRNNEASARYRQRNPRPLKTTDNVRRITQRPAKIHGKHHGLSKTPEYRAWHQMRERCFNPRNNAYKDYGGRGITVCQEWTNFEVFYRDMGIRPSRTHSLDRVNVNGNYEPGNCRWATAEQQADNSRQVRPCEIYGVVYKSIGHAARTLGIHRATVKYRLDHGANGYRRVECVARMHKETK